MPALWARGYARTGGGYLQGGSWNKPGGSTGRRAGSCIRPTPSDSGAETLPTLVILPLAGLMEKAERTMRGSLTSVGSVFHAGPTIAQTLATRESRTPP